MSFANRCDRLSFQDQSQLKLSAVDERGSNNFQEDHAVVKIYEACLSHHLHIAKIAAKCAFVSC